MHFPDEQILQGVNPRSPIWNIQHHNSWFVTRRILQKLLSWANHYDREKTAHHPSHNTHPNSIIDGWWPCLWQSVQYSPTLSHGVSTHHFAKCKGNRVIMTAPWSLGGTHGFPLDIRYDQFHVNKVPPVSPNKTTWPGAPNANLAIWPKDWTCVAVLHGSVISGPRFGGAGAQTYVNWA